MTRPTKIGAGDENKHRWKVVRTDSCTDVPGKLVSADEATGECVMHIAGENQTLNLGHGGIRIVPRGRGDG